MKAKHIFHKGDIIAWDNGEYLYSIGVIDEVCGDFYWILHGEELLTVDKLTPMYLLQSAREQALEMIQERPLFPEKNKYNFADIKWPVATPEEYRVKGHTYMEEDGSIVGGFIEQ